MISFIIKQYKISNKKNLTKYRYKMNTLVLMNIILKLTTVIFCVNNLSGLEQNQYARVPRPSFYRGAGYARLICKYAILSASL